MIGIDISDQSIKVVRLSNNRKNLLSHHMKLLPKGVMENGVVIDRKKMEDEIRSTLALGNISLKVKDSVVASIPETQSFLRVIQIPKMDEFEIHEAVRWEIAQHIPFGLENVYIDWQPSAPNGATAKVSHMEVEVGAAQKKVVDPLYEIINTIGLDVAACELECQAIVRSLISHDWKTKQGVLIIDIGNTGTNVIVYDFGAMRFTAILTQGLVELLKDTTPEDGKEVMNNLNEFPKWFSDRIEASIAVAADALVRDIFGIVQFYNGVDAKREIKEIILTGGGSSLLGLDAVFLKYFAKAHIQRGNPWVNILSNKDIAKPPLDLQESVRFSTAIGLALRPAIPL